MTSATPEPNEPPQLLDLDEAVEFLRGAYARRTLQNLAWRGEIRCIGRGERMRFLPMWLLEDLLAVRMMPDQEEGYEAQERDEPWNSGKEAPSAAQSGESVRPANGSAAPSRSARSARNRRRLGFKSTGTSTASDTGNSRDAGEVQG